MILEISIGFIGIYISMAVSSVVPSIIGIIYFLMFIKTYKLNKY
ncbi:hypothetical protein [Brachyspira pilosicoli]|nr:hypothetical protein [Brachyspira pilosicoli]